MREGLRLDGAMIPRSVKRMFDERGEPRAASAPCVATALLDWRGSWVAVGLVNLSASGAMIEWGEIPHIGEAVSLQLADHGSVPGSIRWVRDGRIGIHFASPLE